MRSKDVWQISSVYSRSENKGLFLFFNWTVGHLDVVGEGNMSIAQGRFLIGPPKDLIMKELISSWAELH